jgi:hypothetical protein
MRWNTVHWGEQFIVFIFRVEQSKKCSGVGEILVDRVCYIDVGDVDVQWLEAHTYALWWCEKTAVEFDVHGSVHRKYIPIYVQQHATLHSLFISGKCSSISSR